ncbi:acyltransferase [Pedobacter deserti]|uniref:acyltransferase n=1 Tax=Pedobacter deserti TaxID=2817382 RepID=UPI00210DE3B7|nr:acyltransferase [Pedobacter sp. SYSU D00382]
MIVNPLKRLLKLYKFLKDPVQYAKDVGVKVGHQSKIATLDFGSEPFLIAIGDHCHITKKVKFITHDGGVWVFRKEVPDLDVFGKIEIRNNVYIGNNSTIMPGVTIGSNVVIGANSLVTKSIPDNCVVAGIPARVISDIDSYKQKIISKNFKTKGLKGSERRRIILQKIDELGIRKDFIKP